MKRLRRLSFSVKSVARVKTKKVSEKKLMFARRADLSKSGARSVNKREKDNNNKISYLNTNLHSSLSHGGTLGIAFSSLDFEWRSKSSPNSLPLKSASAPIRSSSSSTGATLHSKSGVTSSVLAEDDTSPAELSSRGSFSSLQTCLFKSKVSTGRDERSGHES